MHKIAGCHAVRWWGRKTIVAYVFFHSGKHRGCGVAREAHDEHGEEGGFWMTGLAAEQW